MNRVTKSLKWVFNHFFHITIAILVVIYLWWFRLDPYWFPLSPPGGASEEILGIILFIFYVIFSALVKLAKKHATVRALLLGPTILFLLLNAIYIFSYLPSIKTTATYNGVTYYITENNEFMGTWHPWYFQFIKWKNIFDFGVYNLGYDGWDSQYIITYDNKNNAANIVDQSTNKLVYAWSQPFRSCDASAEFGNKIYYLAEDCIAWNTNYADECNIAELTFYQCNLDNTSCELLPFHYAGKYMFDASLVPEKTTNEINLYLDIQGNGTPTLIYTYGEHPRCYVEGCSITTK